ncbi:MAG: S9 family peptidase [Candidatus Krumholzibacteriota bacterium]|nr:S9 family peptidase [Candidatus Krumholzibacteriota bacterium]
MAPAALAGKRAAPPPACPETRVEAVRDTLHGVVIVDPYRWLEDGESAEVRAWTEAQNARTKALLDAVPIREKLRARLTELLETGTIDTPRPRGGRLFWEEREAGQNQPVLYARDGEDAPRFVVVDPNPLSEDGTAAMDWWSPSPDGRLVAYGISLHGSENSTLYLRDVAAGRDLAEAIPNARAAQPSWDADGAGFYYCRYPEAGTVPEGDESYYRTVYHHAVGGAWRDDPLVFRDEKKEAWPQPRVSPCGRWLLVHSWVGHNRTDIRLKDLRDPGGDWIPVAVGEELAAEAYVADGTLYIWTNLGAPNYRVMAADVTAPGIANWRVLVAETGDALESMELAAGRLWLRYLHEASSLVRVFTPDGTFAGELSLPGLGAVGFVSGEWDGPAAYLEYESDFVPPTVYRVDPGSLRLTVHDRLEVDLDTSDYVSELVWYESKDGTPVSMFLVHRKETPRDGSNPTILSGYGGFMVSTTPYFSKSRLAMLEEGLIIARPHLRGGGEYGEAWHEAGMLGNKQNTFDDFIAAAEYLIAEGWTRPERLAIWGGSNGGLLVGAAVVQRPDLFRAAVCGVPLLDMLRYHRFLIARLWIPEYGSSEDPEQFQWLHAYSPYHHVEPGTAYPAVLFTAAESDGRVDPLHARKMAAAMQAATTAKDRPILVYIEPKAGHGVGKPVSKVVEEITDELSFFCWQLGVTGKE